MSNQTVALPGKFRRRAALARSLTVDGEARFRRRSEPGRKPGLTTDMAAKMKALEREVRELRQANEILRKASAYFAQAELDRPFKR